MRNFSLLLVLAALSPAFSGNAFAGSTVVPLPLANSAQVIEGVNGPLVLTSNGAATLRIPFAAQSTPQTLAVTLYFQEKSGFLRASWEGLQAETLSPDVYEGTGLSGQRTFLIPAWRFQQAGTLVLQSGGRELGVQKLRFTWLKQVPVLASSKSAVPAVVLENGESLTERQVLPTPLPPLEDTADGLVLRAALLSEPTVLVGGLIFPITLQAAPAQAKLEFWVSDLPLTARLRIQLKDKVVTETTPSLPDFTDPGYEKINGEWMYAGWRKVSAYLSGEALEKGDHDFVVQAVDADGHELITSWALKEAVLHLRYAAYLPSNDPTPTSVQPTTP
jgi:hypothetical protein